MTSRSWLVTCVLAAGCSAGAVAPPKSEAAPPVAVAAEVTPAGPSFAGATAWLNVDHPLDAASLAGRVVVVDFWTSGCINCIHTLATLKQLEARFANDPVAVIGVHSPKFDAEGESSRLASTLAAYDLHHPVAIDGARAIWDRWGVEAWPTVFVLDVTGRVVWGGAGEPDPDLLGAVVQSALTKGAGKLAKGPLPGLVTPKADPSPLSFPDEVSALGDGRLAVSDTGHHRVVIVEADGSVDQVIGSGALGAADGTFADCSFSTPRGTSYDHGILYVADTESHVVRAANLASRTVTTVAGTGPIGAGPLGEAALPARQGGLRSPWALLVHGGKLYVALAGSHQIGVLDLASGQLRRFAGSGREALTDGAAGSAAFAQPSGLATDGKSLFVADPESSAIRRVDLGTGVTETLVGQGLFQFGDVDGDRATARLQHAAGVAYANGALYVADTYNSKLKKLDLARGKISTVLGGPDRVALFEPGGLAVSGKNLVIADTHHERLVTVPLGSTTVTPLAVTGLTVPAVVVAGAPAAPTLDAKAPELHVSWHVQRLGPVQVKLTWQIPAGTAINDEAPARVRWVHAAGLARTPEPMAGTGKLLSGGLVVPVDVTAATASLDGVLDVVTCDVATHKVCVPLRRNVRATIARGPEQLVASAALPAALP